jgi:hypothetical protein
MSIKPRFDSATEQAKRQNATPEAVSGHPGALWPDYLIQL